MSTSGTDRRAVRAPLQEALDEQIRRLDLVHARLWVALAVFGVAGGVLYAVGQEGKLGPLAAATSGCLGCWFAAHAYLLTRGTEPRWLSVVSGVIEALVPWLFLIVVTAAQGAEYALGSWLPPLLVAAIVVTSTARLRPLGPVIRGAAGAVVFLILYATYVRPRLAPASLSMPLFGWKMQLIRAASISLGAGLAAFVTRALRSAIGRAERSVRERDLFGKYQLEKKIASGGMGVVHRALYCPEGGFVRTVAVKLLHPHLAEQPAFLSAFRSEAEISARLVHPNVVQVLDFGRVGDAYFLAMEFVDGMTLAAMMRRAVAAGTALDEPTVAWIGHSLLSGLAYTHGVARDADGKVLRVVHRDLCPANVLVSRSGEVKISDFGIARALRDNDTSQTRTVAGHLGYMAPEQARAAGIDERVDLFAVGVVLWELLSGRPMFFRGAEGPTLLALMSGDFEPISSLRTDLHAGWDAFFTRALAKLPEDRFANASEMDAALASIVGTFSGDQGTVVAKLVAWALEQPEPPRAPSGSGAPDETHRDQPTWSRHHDAPTSIDPPPSR